MKRIIFLLVLFGLLAALALGQKPTTADEKAKAAEVLGTLSTWADAVRDTNTKALEQLFADDVIITSFDGSVRGKKEELEVLKPSATVRIESVTNEDIGLKIFGDVAVVTALTKINLIIPIIQKKMQPLAMRYTAVFVKREGRWQLVALQSARAPQPASKNSQ
jgi:uncharacterized protein (TIGR02246 family)